MSGLLIHCLSKLYLVSWHHFPTWHHFLGEKKNTKQTHTRGDTQCQSEAAVCQFKWWIVTRRVRKSVKFTLKIELEKKDILFLTGCYL